MKSSHLSAELSQQIDLSFFVGIAGTVGGLATILYFFFNALSSLLTINKLENYLV